MYVTPNANSAPDTPPSSAREASSTPNVGASIASRLPAQNTAA